MIKNSQKGAYIRLLTLSIAYYGYIFHVHICIFIVNKPNINSTVSFIRNLFLNLFSTGKMSPELRY